MAPIPPLVSLSQVATAYSNGTAKMPASGAGAENFAGMVGNAAEAALQTMRSAEQTTAQGVVGKADVQQVVQALSNAEVTMQAVVTIRDKVLSAYNDVMHMSV